MNLVAQIKNATADALKTVFPELGPVEAQTVTVNETKPEFEGDYTVVLFPYVKTLRQKPDALGAQLGDWLLQNTNLFSGFKIVGGFLNLSVRDAYWEAFLLNHFNNSLWGQKPKTAYRAMVEYSSPNTNKPLHFGHLRNIFLGFAVSEILKADGKQVIKANLINDRGIHICKSMIAWKRYANGATPEDSGIKGDHLVGDSYVKYNDIYKAEVADLVAGGMDAKKAEAEAPIFKEAQDMLRGWEAGDPEIYSLWETMNSWVYKGFEVTYKQLGVDFDKYYYESDTYLLGKQLVEEGLQKGVLFRKDDGSVWIDLTNEGLDQKLLLRGDGTSVYMTQDLGTARLKYDDYKLDESIYVIADEQNYHMEVLKRILKRLNEPCANGIYHLSYGMVELPSGKMKSREGTVVDADDMLHEMIGLAKVQTEAAGKTEGFSGSELEALYKMIGTGALKFYLLRVEPKKKMIFNPAESIDLHGYTATFVQYAHARIHSILRKSGVSVFVDRTHFQAFDLTEPVLPLEKELVLQLEQYPDTISAAAAEYNPSLICQYAFALAQKFNSFYAQHSVAEAETPEKRDLRLMLCIMTATVIKHAMNLLGIQVPEKM
ncbi:MAG: arginine--tRNA ligase [Sphingobacteriales bacterium]|nr:MAG: arginine--tRNA ligase [Sphingobacteriales bacterium]